MKRLLLAMMTLAGLGVVVAGYGLWQHYAPVGSTFCNINETFSCDIVNKSAWSELFGIPVAAIGILGFLVIGALAASARQAAVAARPQDERQTVVVLAVLAVAGLIFQVCLTYIELFVIGAVCPVCIVSQVLILGIAVLAVIAWRLHVRGNVAAQHEAPLPGGGGVER
ncbi:MAG: vitamin K epoxide reductase family protein [bacterium]|nr:vitamin K epoxide reductase family protein [bacterium]